MAHIPYRLLIVVSLLAALMAGGITLLAQGPTTVQISSGGDDVNEDGGGYAAGGPTVWIGTAESTSDSYTGLRFANIPVPQGATITSAKLEVYSPKTEWIAISFNIAAEAADNSAAFSANSRPSSRTLTSSKVAHSTNNQWNANTWTNLGEIAPVIQEVVSRGGWQQGSALSIILRGTGGQWGRKFITSAEGNNQNAARLVITYSGGGAPPPAQPPANNPPPSNTNPNPPVSNPPVQPPVVIPDAPVIVVTAIPPTELPPTPTPVPVGSITGQVMYAHADEYSGISLTLTRPDGTQLNVPTGAEGRFAFSGMTPGAYTLQAAAPGYISSQAAFELAGSSSVELPLTRLTAGDTNDDNIIDVQDAALIAANFDGPATVMRADINGDGWIDIRDLTLIGAEFGLIGPLAWG